MFSTPSQREAKGRQDYKILQDELETLFVDLAVYFGGPITPVMTPSIESLAR
jgi:hypothetical protein